MLNSSTSRQDRTSFVNSRDQAAAFAAKTTPCAGKHETREQSDCNT